MPVNKKTAIISLAVVCSVLILIAVIYNGTGIQGVPSNPTTPLSPPPESPSTTPDADLPSNPGATPSPSPTPLDASSPNPETKVVLTNKEKGLSILSNVLRIDLTKYNVTSEENQHSDSSGLTINSVFYTLTATNGNKVTVLVEFTNGKLYMLHVLEVGTLYLSRPAISSSTELAKNFLSNYQTFTSDPIYGELMAPLNNLDVSQNVNITSGNCQLQVYDGNSQRPSFKWYYTYNGVAAEYSKFLSIGFNNGFIEILVDKWQLYKIGSTNVNISEQQAKAIALETTKTYFSNRNLDNDAFDPKNFNESNVKWTALFFIGSLDTDKTHPGGEFTLYPVWRVGVALNRWYGNMYGLEVEIWADNGEIRSTQEAWSMMTP
jgi:hypothetical protein